jgi:hypothetical protein
MGNPKSYAEQVNAAQMMLTGLKANMAALEKRGLTPEFVSTIESVLGETIAGNGKQETLKSELKAATTAVDNLLAQLAKLLSEATKVVKLELPADNWLGFGITAKR